MNRVLVVAAHPDDEVLGCGGTIAIHSDRGDEVHVLLLADGVSSRGAESDQLERRRSAAHAAADVLGVGEIVLGDFPDNRMDDVPLLEIVKTIEKHVQQFKPQFVYTHSLGDLNVDHQLAHQATVTACRPMAGSSVRQVAAYEVLSSSEWASPQGGLPFVPRQFVDVSSVFDRKLKALDCYAEEMRPYPHPRSPEAVTALAVFRGASAGFERAEAFDVIRQLTLGPAD